MQPPTLSIPPFISASSGSVFSIIQKEKSMLFFFIRPIKFVRQYKARKVIYDVEMYSAGASQAIRDAFGLFWRKKSGKRLPPDLKGISFTNATTFPTRVRLRLLKELCRRHQLSNPNLSCYVTSYLARPELKNNIEFHSHLYSPF